MARRSAVTEQRTPSIDATAVVVAVTVVPEQVVRRTTKVLIGLWIVLCLGQVLSVLIRFGTGRETVLGVVPFLNLNQEAALGTWVASILLLTCSLLSAASAWVTRSTEPAWQRSWWLLSAVFLLMSLDEVATVHDRLSPALQAALGTSGVLYFAWVIPALALGLASLVYQLRFLRHLGRTGRDLVLAGVVFVTGAAGFEMAQGVFRDDGGAGSPWDVFPTMEELLEFAGIMWALPILLSYLLTHLPRPPAPPAWVPAGPDTGLRRRRSDWSGERSGAAPTTRSTATAPPP